MRQSPFAPMSALALAGTLMICSQAAAVPIYALGAGANANTLVPPLAWRRSWARPPWPESSGWARTA